MEANSPDVNQAQSEPASDTPAEKPAATAEELTAQLAAVTAERDAAAANFAIATAERDAAAAKLKEIDDAKTMAEVDALLGEYEMPDDAKGAMRELATADREKAKMLLGAMPKKAAPKAEEPKAEASKEAAGTDDAPDAPMHDPKGMAKKGASQADRDAAVKDYMKKKGVPFSIAWASVKREQPALFDSQAA